MRAQMKQLPCNCQKNLPVKLNGHTHTHRGARGGRANVSRTQLFGGRCYLFSLACPSSSITHTLRFFSFFSVFFLFCFFANTNTHVVQHNDTLRPCFFRQVDRRKDCKTEREMERERERKRYRERGMMRRVKPEGEGWKQLEVKKVSQPVVLL